MTLFSLGFAVCELRKALIYKGSWRAGKTPKAGVAGSIPAGRTNPSKALCKNSPFDHDFPGQIRDNQIQTSYANSERAARRQSPNAQTTLAIPPGR